MERAKGGRGIIIGWMNETPPPRHGRGWRGGVSSPSYCTLPAATPSLGWRPFAAPPPPLQGRGEVGEEKAGGKGEGYHSPFPLKPLDIPLVLGASKLGIFLSTPKTHPRMTGAKQVGVAAHAVAAGTAAAEKKGGRNGGCTTKLFTTSANGA